GFDRLAEEFEEFQEFRRLAECVALAKWIKRNGITFDWEVLKNRAVAEQDVPAYVPAFEWSCEFNGRNLDGWRLNLPTGEFDSSVERGALTVRPAGGKPLELFASTWHKDYDVRYSVVTEGPVEFVVREGPGDSGAAATINTKGQPQKVELFLANGE